MFYAEQKLNISVLIPLKSVLQASQVVLLIVIGRLMFLVANLIVKLHLN